MLAIEATNASYTLPEKGLVGPHALFDPAMLDIPQIDDAFRAQQSDTQSWQVKVKRRGAISTITYPFNPLDAIGWHGDLTVVRINVKDIRPLMSHRYHLPPSAHTTFVGNRFVVCTFVPRPFESDPGALKVPFFHNNDDYDEVIFYHAGNFFSRDNIHPGMVTLHPAGFTHGPHPKALKNMLTQAKPATDEVRGDDRRARRAGDHGRRARRRVEPATSTAGARPPKCPSEARKPQGRRARRAARRRRSRAHALHSRAHDRPDAAVRAGSAGPKSSRSCATSRTRSKQARSKARAPSMRATARRRCRARITGPTRAPT